jgi:hypothetical protein
MPNTKINLSSRGLRYRDDCRAARKTDWILGYHDDLGYVDYAPWSRPGNIHPLRSGKLSRRAREARYA